MKLLYFFTIFLIAPKIDLISFGGSALRAEDFVWVGAIVVHLTRPGRHAIPNLPRHFKWFFLYLLVALVAFVVNLGDAGWGGIFYILRQFQYCTWGLMVLSVAPTIRRADLEKHLQIVGLVLAAWGGLEFLGLIPKVGKFSSVAGRLAINTSGPFESSVLLVILGFAARNVVLKGSLMLLMVLTQARITLLGAIAAALAARPKLLAPALVAGAVLAVALPIAKPLLEESRFSETQGAGQMAETLSFMWGTVPTFENRREFLVGAGYIDKGGGDYLKILYSRRGDLSFDIRAHRWAFILKTWLQHPVQILVGYGPGYFGQGVDSNFVRLIGESGVVGTACFAVFLISLLNYRRVTLTWAAIACMIVTGIFIDIFWSSKVMTLLWFISSWEFLNRQSLANPVSLGENQHRPTEGRFRARVSY